MTRSVYKPLVWLMWLAFAVTALDYWRAWDQLPTRIAVHFDANWQPNGYTSREGALMLGLGVMGVLLFLFTLSCLIAHALKPAVAWPMLVICYVLVAFLWYGNHSIVKWNLQRNQPSPRAANEMRGGLRDSMCHDAALALKNFRMV